MKFDGLRRTGSSAFADDDAHDGIRMTFDERLDAICEGMQDRGLDLVAASHDGAHFIETTNPVMVLSGFKSLGPAACIVDCAGERTLVVTPAWDADRAQEICPDVRVVGADDVEEGLRAALPESGKVGTAGLAAAPFGVAARASDLIPDAVPAGDTGFCPARRKATYEMAVMHE